MITFLLIWIIPIIFVFYKKYKTLKSGTIKDLCTSTICPLCQKCTNRQSCGIDWWVIVPGVGMIYAIYLALYPICIKISNTKIK